MAKAGIIAQQLVNLRNYYQFIELLKTKNMNENSEQEMILKAQKSVKLGDKRDDPQLVILMGLPGSGKSYSSKYLNEKYGFTILSGENITVAIFGTDKCGGAEYAQAYKILRQLANKLILEGYSIVIDGTNLKRVFREQITKEVKCDRIKLIYLKTDDTTAIDRVTSRGIDLNDQKDIKSSITKEKFNSFKDQLEEPSEAEKAFIIDSDDKLFSELDLIFEKGLA